MFILYFAFLKRIDWCFIDLPSFWTGENCWEENVPCCTYLRTTIHLPLSFCHAALLIKTG